METKYFIHYILTKYINKIPLPDGSFKCSDIVHQHGRVILDLPYKLDNNDRLKQCEEILKEFVKDKDSVVTICNFFECR